MSEFIIVVSFSREPNEFFRLMIIQVKGEYLIDKSK